jgi:hypothetical protein
MGDSMARITQFNQVRKERHSTHQETTCNYDVFVIEGERYLQIETLGSAERQVVGVPSQTIQFDQAAIAELKRILATEFPDL